jgi:hypothetical protein
MWGSRGPAPCSWDSIPGGASCNQWQLESGEYIRVNERLELLMERETRSSRLGTSIYTL